MPRDLTCGEARGLASELLDGLLPPHDAAAVQAHVASCTTCPGLYRAMVAAQERMQSLGAEVVLPSALASGLGETIRDTTG